VKKPPLAQDMFFGLVFVICNVWALIIVTSVSIAVFGRPRGVSYGILLEVLLTILTLHGALMVLWFRLLSNRLALCICLGTLLGITVLLMPSFGERPILSICVSAMIFCLAFAFWHQRRLRAL